MKNLLNISLAILIIISLSIFPACLTGDDSAGSCDDAGDDSGDGSTSGDGLGDDVTTEVASIEEAIGTFAIPGISTMEIDQSISESGLYKNLRTNRPLAAVAYLTVTAIATTTTILHRLVFQAILTQLATGNAEDIDFELTVDSSENVTKAVLSFSLTTTHNGTTYNPDIVFTAEKDDDGDTTLTLNITCSECVGTAIQSGTDFVKYELSADSFDYLGNVDQGGTGTCTLYSPETGEEFISIAFSITDENDRNLRFDVIDEDNDNYGSYINYRKHADGTCFELSVHNTSEDTDWEIDEDIESGEGMFLRTDDSEICWDSNKNNINCGEITTSCIE
ncbi:MAG: hypothetical protein ABIA04_14160 [Pseudomonadota bacterium]